METTFQTVQDPNGVPWVIQIDWENKQGEWTAVDFRATTEKDLRQFCMVAREFLKG